MLRLLEPAACPSRRVLPLVGRNPSDRHQTHAPSHARARQHTRTRARARARAHNRAHGRARTHTHRALRPAGGPPAAHRHASGAASESSLSPLIRVIPAAAARSESTDIRGIPVAAAVVETFLPPPHPSHGRRYIRVIAAATAEPSSPPPPHPSRCRPPIPSVFPRPAGANTRRRPSESPRGLLSESSRHGAPSRASPRAPEPTAETVNTRIRSACTSSLLS